MTLHVWAYIQLTIKRVAPNTSRYKMCKSRLSRLNTGMYQLTGLILYNFIHRKVATEQQKDN